MLTAPALRHGTGRNSPTERVTFRSMGMDIGLITPSPASGAERRATIAAAGHVQRIFHQADVRFSRFRADSELSRVNASAGRWQLVSAPFAELLKSALDAARATEGLFDPTILPELLAAGYDRDFSEVRRSPAAAAEPPDAPKRWPEVRLDGRLLFLPAGAGLDFGGIAKGWAADLAATGLRGLPWALVDAGGDLRLAGRPDGRVTIGVADPGDARVELVQLQLEGGALATSSVIGRSWGPGLHHLIDPRTSRPARTGVVQATVWAETCTEAEVLSKWALLRGPRVLREIPAVLLMEAGRVLVSIAGAKQTEAAAC